LIGFPAKKRLAFLLALLLASGAGLALRSVSITLTPSVKYRIWWLSGDVDQVRRGRYVLLRLPEEAMQGMRVSESVRQGEDIRAIKRVGCDAGELLRRRGRAFFCGEEFLGAAKEQSSSGEPLAPADVDGRIPAGSAFLIGDRPDSFDSRYFGLVSKDRYLAWARPIF